MTEFGRGEISEADQRLQALLTYKNPNAQEIESIVREVEEDRRSGLNYDAEGSSALVDRLENHPKAKALLKERLAGEILVDLGGGDNPYFTANISEDAGVNLLVDVDFHLWEGSGADATRLPYSLTKDVSKEMRVSQRPGMKLALVRADMLDFVSRLRSDSVNFTINAIDSIIIKQSRYHQLLAEEMLRATKPGGVIIGIHSEVIGYLQNRPEFESASDSTALHHPDERIRMLGGTSKMLIKKSETV